MSPSLASVAHSSHDKSHAAVNGSPQSSDPAAAVRVPNPHSVLIVDDDLGTRETFAMALEQLGLEVRAADTGAQGLKIARSRPFDLLLVDLELPDMRGTELVRALQKEGVSAAQFVLVSGYLKTGVTVEAMRLGALDVMEKPVSIDALTNLVSSLIHHLRAQTSVLRTSDRESKVQIDVRLPLPPGSTSAAQRWALHTFKACNSPDDLKNRILAGVRAGMTVNQLRYVLFAMGLAAFAVFGILGWGRLAVAGWMIAATAAVWHVYIFLRNNWRRFK